MLSIFERLTAKKFVLLGIFATGLWFADLLITSAVSKSYRHAIIALFSSKDMPPSMGKLQKLFLYSTGFYGRGGYSCSYFSFFALTENGLEVVHVQVRQRTPTGVFEVSEITRGVGAEFAKSCSLA